MFLSEKSDDKHSFKYCSNSFGQNRNEYIYNPGVDEFTGNYETSFDASYNGLKCKILYYEMSKSVVMFENGREEIVDTIYLNQV